jgi:toxin ParE1/3/4
MRMPPANFLTAFHEHYQRLSEHFEMGRLRPEFGRDIRSFPFERNYLIVYRPIEGGIEILRFLHGSRDIDKLV